MTTPTHSKKKKAEKLSKDKIIAWEAPEYQYVQKTKDWFWVVGSIGIFVSIGSFWMDNWSFAILVLLATIILIYLAIRKPRAVNIKLNVNKKIITINKAPYYLSNYKAFNISEYSGNLLLQSKKKFAALTIIPLPEQAPIEKITTILEDDLNFAQDESLHEPLLEVILGRLGF
ncbi:MAG: hypothetical protein ACKKL4_02435 [Patescibacteria group bacterium]